MSRLNTFNYLKRRAALQEEWFTHDAYAFVLLSPTEQIVLHAFFEPTKRLTVDELIEHRRKVTTEDPSLPHRAGRAFARLRPFLDLTPANLPLRTAGERDKTWKAKDRQARVFSQVNPELDPEAFAKIIMELARQGPPPGYEPQDKTS